MQRLTYLRAGASIFFYCLCNVTAIACDKPIAVIVALNGHADVLRLENRAANAWARATHGMPLCAGDSVTVRAQSRALIRLHQQITTRVDELTTLTVADVAEDRSTEMNLQEGLIHVLSRFRGRLRVISPFVNAHVDGTEFTVGTDSKHGEISVAEGKIRATTKDSEMAVVGGQAVQADSMHTLAALELQPIDAIRWAIDYPQILILSTSELNALAPEVKTPVLEAQRFAISGDFYRALAKLPDNVPSVQNIRASYLLALGRWRDAQKIIEQNALSPSAQALNVILQITRNENEAALKNAQALVTTQPQAASYLALSYALQTRHETKAALEAAKKATELQAENPIAWARVAELALGLSQLQLGRTAAEHAIALQADTVNAKALQAFADLLQGHTETAHTALQAIVTQLPEQALAHYALGLAQVRRGQLAAGREQLEIAVMLAPTNVQYRSALARAYLKEGRDHAAQAELGLARILDPLDPTPWIIEAQRQQQANQPIAALNAMNEARKLSSYRNVWRSPELQTSDRAAYSADIASSYQDLNLNLSMQAAAGTTLNEDFQSGASHRFMADAYAANAQVTPHENARISELLQARLRQSIGQTPQAAQAFLTNLPTLDGPRALSPQETGALFERKDTHFELSGLFGTQRMRGASALASYANENVQTSISRFDYDTEGFQPNGDIRIGATRFENKWQLNPRTQIYTELFGSERNGGDITQRLTQDNSILSQRNTLEDRTLRTGFHYTLNPQQELLGLISLSHTEEHPQSTSLASGATTTADIETRTSARHAELQFNQQGERYTLKAGMNWHREGYKQRGDVTIQLPPIEIFPGFFVTPAPIVTAQNNAYQVEDDSVYVQTKYDLNSTMAIDLGLNYRDYRDNRSTATHNSVDKQLGASWAFAPLYRARIAYIEALTGSPTREQNLQAATFNSFATQWDDPRGTRSKQLGLKIDRDWQKNLSWGAQWMRRKLEVPLLINSRDDLLSWRGYTHHAYLALAFNPETMVHVAWQYESQNLASNLEGSTFPIRTHTEHVPIQLWRSLGPELSAAFEVRHVRQNTTNRSAFVDSLASEHFWVSSLLMKYQPWHNTTLNFNIRNLFDQHFRYQNTDLLGSTARIPLVYPERSIWLQATIAF